MPEPRALPIRVLLIEDSPEDADLLVMELRRSGYLPDYKRVETEAEMRAALNGPSWDLILCDYTMPHFNVAAALEIAREVTADTPFVVTSATIVDQAAIAAVRAGARGIVMKQNLGALLPVIRRELKDSELRSLGKNVLRELEKREWRFRAMIEKSSDAIALTDERGQVVYASPSTSRVLGFQPEELAGTRWAELLHPDELERTRAVEAELAARPGQPVSAQMRARHRDGSWRWLETVSTNFLLDPDIGAVISNYRDITERRQFEQELQESQAVYASLAEAVPSILFTNLTDGSTDYVSPRFYAFTGLPPGSALTRGWMSAVHPDDVDRAASTWRRAISERAPFEMELRLGRADGEYRWFLVRSIPMRNPNGQIVKWFGSSTDIDDRKRAEEKLRASEERFRALIENSADGFALLSDKGSVTYLGHSILGYSPDEGVGGTVAELIHPEDRQEVSRKFRQILENPGKAITTRYRAKHRDGTWRSIESVSKNLRDNPSVGAIVVNYRDVTERRQIEEQLLQTQKLESLGLLAGGIAHDFNNLLTGIMGNASMVLETMSRENPQRSALQDLLTASKRAADLTHQMLAFAGKGRFVTRLIDVSDLVEEISHLVRSAVPKNVQVRLQLARNLPAVEADPSQIQQLIMNLVINAVEAIGEDNSGSVLVMTGVEQVDHAYLDALPTKDDIEAGKYVCVDVTDTGTGMDEETKARIFDPFFTTKFLGRGLGLAATMGIVRGHKGAIKVDSAVGKGTTFKVLLPAAGEAARAPAAAELHRDLHGSGRVLVVDDEEIVRKTAKTTLEQYGYQVVLAEHGPAAIQILQQLREQVQAVLLDMTMPLMTGEEVFRQLKAIVPGLPIVISSGYNEIEAIRRFTGRGIAGFIQKPYTSAQLAAKIKDILAERPPSIRTLE